MMAEITHWWAFVLAGVVLNLTPGPDSLYILGRSTTQGSQVGLLSALGIALGSVGHTLLAALGLSALLATSALAFSLLKLAGAAYLFWLGIRLLRRPGQNRIALTPHADLAPLKVLREAFFINLFNPKVALFFLAFLPQFVKPGAGPVAFMLLGLSFVATGLIWSSLLALLSARLGTWLRQRGVTRRLDQLCGSLFILLGLNLLFSKMKA